VRSEAWIETRLGRGPCRRILGLCWIETRLGRGPCRRFLNKSADTADDVTSPIGVVHNAAKRFTNLFEIRWSFWLRSFGLGKYEAAFRENEIDETILPNLTAEDLKDLGVSIVGHRRKLLDAIAALHTDTVKTPSADAAAPPSATNRPTARNNKADIRPFNLPVVVGLAA
jgi:SAM domain (Sterile alpha motif)